MSAPPTPAERAEVDEEPATPEAVVREADSLLRRVRELQLELDSSDEPIAVRARVAQQISSTIDTLGRLTGVAIVNERQILNSPAWSRVLDGLRRGLRDHPEALGCVLSELKGMHQ